MATPLKLDRRIRIPRKRRTWEPDDDEYENVAKSLEPQLKRRKISNRNNPSYPIFVRAECIINRTLTFIVKDVWKINDILLLVSNKVNIPTQSIHLLYGHKHLSPNKSLKEYGIDRDSTLTATIPIRDL